MRDSEMSYQERIKVLVRVYADGFIQVFADQKGSIDLVCQQVLSVDGNFTAEQWAEDYADLNLPLRFKHADLRSIGQHYVTVATPEEEHSRIIDMKILEEVRRLAADLQEIPR